MNNIEKGAIRIVAKLSPWLAPFPSAFFVAWSSMKHLDPRLLVAVIVAAIIETLGLATVHTALWAYDWNTNKRKTDPQAPMVLAVVLGAAYIVATWGLVVVLEVVPWLSTYAPAIFPALAVVGAINLAMVSLVYGSGGRFFPAKKVRREQLAAFPEKWYYSTGKQRFPRDAGVKR